MNHKSKPKPICQFGENTATQCANISVTKWGDCWLCNDHAGERKKLGTELVRLWEKGAVAWKDVPDATAWVEDLRVNGPACAAQAETGRFNQ